MDETTNPWKILSETPVYSNPWIQLTEYAVINPSGGNGIYGKVHFEYCAVFWQSYCIWGTTYF